MTWEMLWMDSQRRSDIYGHWTQRLWWRKKKKTDRNLGSKASVKPTFQAQLEHKLIVTLNKPLSLSGLLVLGCKITINRSALSHLPLSTVQGIGRHTTYANPLTAMKYSEKKASLWRNLFWSVSFFICFLGVLVVGEFCISLLMLHKMSDLFKETQW